MYATSDFRNVIALGFFDGVHLGHAALLNTTSERARQLDAVSCAMTFDLHPSYLYSKHPAPMITTSEERCDLMRRLCGIQNIIVTHFDESMLSMDWKDFLVNVLFEKYHAIHVVAGYDYHFGYRGRGNTELLVKTCSDYGIGCDIIPQVTLNGQVVSSTRIRNLIMNGQIEEANKFLGHPYCFSGEVKHGRHLGTNLGFPTVNIPFPDKIMVPPLGAYTAQIILGDAVFPAAVNIGYRPTADSSAETLNIESHILDFSGNLYGRKIRVELLRFLRPEQKFSSLEELRTAIAQNVKETRAYFKQ